MPNTFPETFFVVHFYEMLLEHNIILFSVSYDVREAMGVFYYPCKSRGMEFLYDFSQVNAIEYLFWTFLPLILLILWTLPPLQKED